MSINKILDKITRRLSLKWNNMLLNNALAKQAEQDAFKFVYERSSKHTIIYDEKQKLRDAVFNKRIPSGDIFEFGVFKGLTVNLFAKALMAEGDQRKVYGFDSFRGFSEDWNGIEKVMPSSKFDRNGIYPEVESNVELIDGYIENTLPNFIKKNNISEVSFIHIDTDTHSPAFTVLSLLRPHLVKGSIILFDELCGYPNWRNHEWLALEQTFSDTEYEFLGFANGQGRPNLMSAAIRIK